MRSLRTSSETVSSSVTVSRSSRTRSLGTVRFSTTGSSAWSVTSCSSSDISGPSSALSRLESVIGSRSTRTFSRVTGTVLVTFSVTTCLRSRTRPASRLRADSDLLLRTRHRVVGLRAGDVLAHGAASGRRVVADLRAGARHAAGAGGPLLGEAAVGGALAVAQAVVAGQLRLPPLPPSGPGGPRRRRLVL